MQRQPDEVIGVELGPREELLWSGRPRLGLMLYPTDAFAIPFSLLWGGGAIFWEVSAIMNGAPLFLVLWGIPFVVIGLYLMIGRFFLDARQREQTYYGVTTERVVIVSGLSTRCVNSLTLDTLAEISLDERSDGSGIISFGASSLRRPRVAKAWQGMGQQRIPTFNLNEQAREVYELIRSAQQDAKRR